MPPLVLDKKRFRAKNCPCGKNNKDGKFVPYVGHDDKGYCHSCGETFLPELPAKGDWPAPRKPVARPLPKPPAPPIQRIAAEVFKASLAGYGGNHLVGYLAGRFGEKVASELVARYYVGTSKRWPGATVFWLLDGQGPPRSGKIILYDAETGKRVKEPHSHIDWAHSVLKMPGFRLSRCLYGLHLLNLPENRGKPVGLVESEKTAIIASAYLPEYIWLATGGKGNLTAELCHPLKGRKVIIWPDLGACDLWETTANGIEDLAGFGISDLLELNATEAERAGGLDLADYLLRQALPSPEPPEPLPPPPATAPAPEPAPAPNIGHGEYIAGLYMEAGRLMAPGGYPASWDTCAPYLAQETRHFAALAAKNPLVLDLVQGLGLEVSASGALLPPREQAPRDSWADEVDELAKWFAGAVLPVGPVSLGGGGKVTDCRKFIDAHLEVAKTNDGKATFLPYLQRLRLLKDQMAASQPAQPKPLEP